MTSVPSGIRTHSSVPTSMMTLPSISKIAFSKGTAPVPSTIRFALMAVCIASTATRPTKQQCGGSTYRLLLDYLAPLILPSRHHSTALQSQVCSATVTTQQLMQQSHPHLSDVEKHLVLYQELLPFRVFGLSMGKVESRRADSNRLPLLQLRVCLRTY